MQARRTEMLPCVIWDVGHDLGCVGWARTIVSELRLARVRVSKSGSSEREPYEATSPVATRSPARSGSGPAVRQARVQDHVQDVERGAWLEEMRGAKSFASAAYCIYALLSLF